MRVLLGYAALSSLVVFGSGERAFAMDSTAAVQPVIGFAVSGALPVDTLTASTVTTVTTNTGTLTGTRGTFSQGVNQADNANFAPTAGIAQTLDPSAQVGGNQIVGAVADAVHADSSDASAAATHASTADTATTAGTAASAAELTGSISGGQVIGAVQQSLSSNNLVGMIDGSQVTGTVANASHSSTSDTATSSLTANIATSASYATAAGSASSLSGTIDGSQVTGIVANAAHSSTADTATTATSAGTTSGPVIADGIVAPRGCTGTPTFALSEAVISGTSTIYATAICNPDSTSGHGTNGGGGGGG